jgi:hypothetical protein
MRSLGVAQADLEAAQRLLPDDRAIAAELAALRRTRREELAAQAQLFKGFLPRGAEAPARGLQQAQHAASLWATFVVAMRRMLGFLFPFLGWQTR